MSKHSSPFDIRQNVGTVVLYSMFDVRSFEAINKVFEFNYQKKNAFKSVICSIK